MAWLRALFGPWAWRMAWRDSRRSRARLLLFVSAMTIGVAALVAISSFGANLEAAVDGQARSILGADLRVRSRQEFSEESERVLAERIVERYGAQEARLVSFASMVYFPGADEARLSRVRALEGGYPFYGAIETDPPAAAEAFREGRRALVDGALLAQFGARVGDPIRVGAYEYEIAGALLKIPGESEGSAMFGPRVYVPLAELDPDLVVRGSRVSRYRYYRLGSGVDPEELEDELRDHAREFRLRIDTPEDTSEWIGRAMRNLYGFLNLVGFVALLLGGIGVGSAIHVYVRRKRGIVATLRCLGAPAPRVFAIYAISAACLGAIGALAGALLGLGVQRLLPLVLADWIPLELELSVSWISVGIGVGVGVVTALAFAALPLLPLRRIPPFAALRASLESGAGRRDWLRLAVMGAIALFVFAYAWQQSQRLWPAVFYTAGLVVAFSALALCARLLRALARRVLWRRLSFEWRQGLANLYRPDNQTMLMMVSIGLGAFLVLTLYQMRLLLLDELTSIASGTRPNVVLFDIQDDQLEGVTERVREAGLEVHETVPIINMHLASINGRTVAELREEREGRSPGWMLRREYRSTWRETLADTEQLTAGEWIGRADPAAGPVPISLEERIVEGLELELGDELVWDVQGVDVRTRLASVREVDWRRLSPNFFAVFPAGVLEEAPVFHVLIARAEDTERIGHLQRSLILRYPNVSTIDVTLILEIADDLLEQLSFAVQFMSLFSILTGLLVLISSVLTSRFQRLEESVLLRTLGATKRQVLRIMNVEFLLLGTLATLTGALLSILGCWGLAAYAFELDFTVAWVPLVVSAAAIIALTVLIGRLASRGLHDRPPLEVLRVET